MIMDAMIQPVEPLAFFLVFIRMAGFFFLFPVFARPYCPPQLALFLALVCAALLMPVIPDPQLGRVSDWEAVLCILRELAVGITLGFSTLMILVVTHVAGQFVDFQMGFFTASEVDPMLGIRVPLVGNLLYLFSLVLFLSFNGHHHLLRVLCESYAQVPLGAPLSGVILPHFISLMSWLFRAALQISLPVLACLFVTAVVLGILSRAMPQLNLFVLGIPLRIAVGMTMLLAMTSVYAGFFRESTSDRVTDLFRLLRVW